MISSLTGNDRRRSRPPTCTLLRTHSPSQSTMTSRAPVLRLQPDAAVHHAERRSSARVGWLDRDDVDEVVERLEVIRIAGVQR